VDGFYQSKYVDNFSFFRQKDIIIAGKSKVKINT
jgi:hypothetical protein